MKIEIDKPVVPQFVAEWIERAPKNRNIKGLLEDINSWEEPEIMEWCRNVDDGLNFKTLVTACLYGYEVEQEPLYYAKIKGWELTNLNSYWNAFLDSGAVFPEAKTQGGIYTTQLTKQQWNELGINDTNADFEVAE